MLFSEGPQAGLAVGQHNKLCKMSGNSVENFLDGIRRNSRQLLDKVFALVFFTVRKFDALFELFRLAQPSDVFVNDVLGYAKVEHAYQAIIIAQCRYSGEPFTLVGQFFIAEQSSSTIMSILGCRGSMTPI